MTWLFTGLSCKHVNASSTAPRENCGYSIGSCISSTAIRESITQISSVDESSENGPAQKELQELQEAANQTSSSYELIAVFKDKKKRWNFEFDNGEVWQQTEPGYLHKPENLPIRVDISKGVFGSHDLRADNFGKSVKVKQIN